MFLMRKVVYLLFLLTFYFPLNAQISIDPSPIDGNDTTLNLVCKNVDVKAQFTGGDVEFLNYVRSSFILPAKCVDCMDGFTQSIKFNFVVDKNGLLKNIQIEPGEHRLSADDYHLIESEFIRVLQNSPRWFPGQVAGKVVNSNRVISFEIFPENTTVVNDPAKASDAKFPGGQVAFSRYIQDQLVFPMRCKLAKINGNVMARFIVNPDGKVSNVEIIEHNYLCPEFSKEAIRVISQSPKWIPASIDGKIVKCFQTVPIRFLVEEN